MNTTLAKVEPSHPDALAIEAVLVQGDLSKLTVPQRVSYYNQVCESVGLNPLTRPFEYLNLNGALRLYARRDCTDQLRKIHSVSVRITARDRGDDVYVVTAQATFPNGRSDESTGAVPIARLQGEALANALMKAETKAKRRVTLSICGLSVLDESELDGVREQVRDSGPHSPHGDPADYPRMGPSSEPETVDAALYDSIIGRIATVRNGIDACVTYQQALTLRALLGNKANPQAAELTRDLNRAQSEKLINFDGLKKISQRWQHCDRKVAELEKKLAPSAEASFSDPEPEADPDDVGGR